MNKMTLVVLALLALASMPVVAGENDDAVATASKWLSMIDNGNYAGSWQEAADSFRRRVTQAQWKASMQQVRAPLGKLRSRALKSAQRKTSLPGAPDGDYLVMQFSSAFAHKAAAVETVTFVRIEGEDWRAAGYFIR